MRVRQLDLVLTVLYLGRYVAAENGKITVLSNADPASVARLSGWMGYFIAGFCRGFQKLGAPCSYEGQLMTVTLLQNQQLALGRERVTCVQLQYKGRRIPRIPR